MTNLLAYTTFDSNSALFRVFQDGGINSPSLLTIDWQKQSTSHMTEVVLRPYLVLAYAA